MEQGYRGQDFREQIKSFKDDINLRCSNRHPMMQIVHLTHWNNVLKRSIELKHKTINTS